MPEVLFSSAGHKVLFPCLSFNAVTVRKLTVAVLSACTDWVASVDLQVRGFGGIVNVTARGRCGDTA